MDGKIISTLDWEVKEQLFSPLPNQPKMFKVLSRSDTNEVLGMFSTQYQSFSNADLTELCSQLEQTGLFTIEGYTTFKKGKKVLAYLKNNNQMVQVAGHYLKNLLIINVDWVKSHNINDLLEPVILKTGKSYTKSRALMIIDYLQHVNERNIVSRRRNTRNKKKNSANYAYNNNNNNNSNNGLTKKQRKYPKANVNVNNNNSYANKKPYGKSKKNGKSKGSRRY